MILTQFEHFWNVRFVFETVMYVNLIALMAQFPDLYTLPSGNPWHFFRMNGQEKDPFVQNLVMGKIVQQCLRDTIVLATQENSRSLDALWR